VSEYQSQDRIVFLETWGGCEMRPEKVENNGKKVAKKKIGSKFLRKSRDWVAIGSRLVAMGREPVFG